MSPRALVGRGRAAFGLLPLLALTGSPEPAAAQSWADLRASRQLQQESELEVVVRYGAGRFALAPLPTPHLYRMELRYDEEAFDPIHRYRDGHLELGVEGTGRTTRLPRGEGAGELRLGLSDRIPMDLRLNFGAVRADLDLGGLRIRTLELSTGASDSEMRVTTPNPTEMEWARIKVGAASFEGRGLGNLNAAEVDVEAGVGRVVLDLSGLRRADTRLRASMGVGSLEIRVPEGVGIRVSRSTFLTAFEGPDLERRDGVLYSPEWDRADRRLRVDVDAAFGRVSVVRIER